MSCRLAYFTVITDVNMVESVPKTWRERFTWKFWITHKIVPMRTMIISDENRTIICHPSMKEIIEEDIERLI